MLSKSKSQFISGSFLKPSKKMIMFAVAAVFALYMAACNDNSVEDTQTDDQFITDVITNGYSTPNGEDDDLFKALTSDLDDGGPVSDHDGSDTPIDSLMKWGRIITGTSVNVNITSEGDSLKNANITRTITGNFVIIGLVNGVVDTIVKPYTQEFRRTAVFKRVDRQQHPRRNWRLYKVSMVDGKTTIPQNSDDYVQMQQLQIYVNGTLINTFAGPDFTQNLFITKNPHWNGGGIPEVNLNDQVKIVVTTYSTQSEQDIVAWHWGKRNLGFHRERFIMTGETPSGSGWTRTFEKTFTINGGHHHGRFNGFISASTHKSLYDDSPVEFASDCVGAPYRVMP